jgi:hypothetical protein
MILIFIRDGDNESMKKRVLVMLAETIIIMISAVITIQQLQQTAQAFPCVGDSSLNEEYCTGYHDGAIQAHKDFNTIHGLDVEQHRCAGSVDYCNGYNRGYSDESDILG